MKIFLFWWIHEWTFFLSCSRHLMIHRSISMLVEKNKVIKFRLYAIKVDMFLGKLHMLAYKAILGLFYDFCEEWKILIVSKRSFFYLKRLHLIIESFLLCSHIIISMNLKLKTFVAFNWNMREGESERVPLNNIF